MQERMVGTMPGTIVNSKVEANEINIGKFLFIEPEKSVIRKTKTAQLQFSL